MTRIALYCLWALAAGTLLAAAPAAAQQKPNTAEALLQQCQAYISGNAEVMAEMTCENTIWSVLKSMGVSKAIAPSFRAPYCKPEGLELSVNWAAQNLRRIRQQSPRPVALSRRARRAFGPPKLLPLPDLD